MVGAGCADRGRCFTGVAPRPSTPRLSMRGVAMSDDLKAALFGLVVIVLGLATMFLTVVAFIWAFAVLDVMVHESAEWSARVTGAEHEHSSDRR